MSVAPSAAAASTAVPPSSTDVPSPSRHSRCVVVSNLSPVLTLPILEDLFSTIGPIQSLHFHTPHPSSPPVCIVQFVHEKHADTALLITDTPIGDRNIRIQHYTEWSSQQQSTTSAPSSAPAPAAAPTAPAVASPTGSSTAALSPLAGAATAASPSPSSAPAATPQASDAFSFPLDPTFTSCTIYVGNLAPQVTDAVLHAYFSQLGPLVGTKLQADASSPNRFAFVEFEGTHHAHLALALHGHALLGRPMKIGKAATGVGRPTGQQGLGTAATADKVASALAKVAAAQQLIASKLGVKVQTPAVSTILPVLSTAGLAPAAAAELVAAAAASVAAGGAEGGGEKEKAAPPAVGEEKDDRRAGRSRGSRRHRSSSRSPSRSSSSRSPSRSRSRSGSRSPRRRRHRHGRSSRDRSHRRSKHRRSSSRSPSPRVGERKDGSGAVVGADRWRAEDADEAMEKKESEPSPPPTHPAAADAGRGGEADHSSGRERRREHSRDRSGERSRERSRERGVHGRRAEYHDGHRSGRRRKGWSDDDEDRHSHHRGRGIPHFKRRNKAAADPHQGMVWDGSEPLNQQLLTPRPCLHRSYSHLICSPLFALSLPLCSASHGIRSGESQVERRNGVEGGAEQWRGSEQR